ncbi:MAG: hypothetical protein ACO4AV_13870 [bacterium]
MPQQATTKASSGVPNLKHLATKDMVKTIGSGSYAAEYIPWSRIAEVLNDNAPGWFPELVPDREGNVLHRAPKGGFLLIQFRNVDTGAQTPAFIQAVQDNRHKSIPYDQIDSRDISDTSRRGFVLAAAAVFNLGIQLWTRDQLEDGYSRAIEGTTSVTPKQSKPAVEQPTKENFLEHAISRGLTTDAAEVLLSKLNGNFSGGIQRLAEKDDEWIKSFNESCPPKPSGEGW